MTLQGWVEVASHRRIVGWAQDTDAPDTPVSLILSVNGEVVGRMLANRYRQDLEALGIGKGRHGFEYLLEPPLSRLTPQAIAVRREGDGAHIPDAACALELGSSFDHMTRDAIAKLMSTFSDENDLSERLAFLVDQTDKLRYLYAKRRSGTYEQQNLARPASDVPDVAPPAISAKTIPATKAPPRRALVIDDRMPESDHDAGSNAILSHIRSLQRLGCDVTFAPANLRGDDAHLAAIGVGCCLHPWYTSIEDVLKRHQDAFALVYMHRVTTAARYVNLARDHEPRARLLFSVADLHHVRLARQAEVEQRPELFALSERARLMELTAAWAANAVITHSQEEAKLLRRHMRPDHVHVVPWSMPTRPTAVPFAARRGFAFVGGYGHPPNVDAALWLADAIMPEVEAAGCSAPCLLVGSEMPDRLKALRRHNVDPIGYVRDLSDVFDRIRLTVAPLAFGAGVKGKVLDSLAAGIPCVCTPAAAEGLDLPQTLLDLVGATPSELARSIRDLHNDEALNRACSEAGLAYIQANCSEARVDRLLATAVYAPSNGESN